MCIGSFEGGYPVRLRGGVALVLEPPRLGQLSWQVFYLLLLASISLRPIIKCVYIQYLSSRQLVLIHPLASVTSGVHSEQSNSRLVFSRAR